MSYPFLGAPTSAPTGSMRRVLAVLAAALWATVPVCAAPPPGAMLEWTVQGRTVEGVPLAWSQRELVLLARDGRIWQFPASQARQYRRTSDRFQGYSPSELRSTLLRELGDGYEVSGTGHYLVAHPRGKRDQWADRFEELYRTFVRYFSVRGFSLQEPPFALLGVVCRDREDFVRQAAHGQVFPGRGILGFYSTRTNRILLYDLGSEEPRGAQWQQNASIVIHEATHQMAFNTGIHSRHSPPPTWVAEGLATTFEVVGSGFGEAGSPKGLAHPGWLRQFQQSVAPRHRPELLADLIAGDRVFQTDPSLAYAEAWALTFYLVQTQPRKYVEYLARTAAHAPLERVTAPQRTADFTAVFGDDWRMLEARLLRFMEELR